MPVTNLAEYKHRKGLERLTDVGNAIRESNAELLENFRQWFEIPEDENVQEALDTIWESCCREFFEARTLADCINGQVALENFYREFHPVISKPCPWVGLAVGVEQ